MRLQVLITELLEVVKDLLLNDGRQALDLFDENAFVHFDRTHVPKRVLHTAVLLCTHHVFVAAIELLLLLTRDIALSQLQFFCLKVQQTRFFVDVVLKDLRAQPDKRDKLLIIKGFGHLREEGVRVVARLAILRREVGIELECEDCS